MKKRPPTHSWEYWTTKFLEKHGDRYCYNKSIYINSKTKIEIVCPIHGSFWQSPIDHYNSNGCRSCSAKKVNSKKKKDFAHFKQKCESLNPGKFTYIDENYQGYQYKIGIQCNRCKGIFQARVKNLLNLAGYGCPLCKNDVIGEKNTLTSEEFFSKCSITQQGRNFIYDDKSVFYGLHLPFTFKCPVHGYKTTKALNHYLGQNCIECANEIKGRKLRKDNDTFVAEAKEKHGEGRYLYLEEYTTYKDKMEIGCNVCGNTFHQPPESHLRGHGCPYCNITDSRWQIEIKEYVESLGFITTKESTILNGQEIDIFIKDKSLGIECNGVYFHSEIGGHKKPNYHKKKTDIAQQLNIQLLQFWESDWNEKSDIIKSIICNKLGKSNVKIYARKCRIIVPDDIQVKEFLKDNHIQGHCNSTVRYALMYDNNMVALMTFSKNNKHQWELNRFCNKLFHSVVGGASRLLNQFIIDNNPDEILSFANRMYSNGQLYTTLGFEWIMNTPVSYYYTDYKTIYNKRKFRLPKLKRKFVDFDNTLTERQNMKKFGYDRLYDAGLMKFVWYKK